jgi:hypothetical protein
MTPGRLPIDRVGGPASGAPAEEVSVFARSKISIKARLAAGSGALYVGLIIVGNQMATAGASGSAQPSGAQVLRDLRRQADSAAATTGFVLEVLGFTMFIVFLGYLWSILAASGRPRTGRAGADHASEGIGVTGATALVSGIIALAIKLGSASPVVALMLDREHMDPQLARVLADVNGAAFVLSWLPTALFVGAVALALHAAGLVGRPTAWCGAAIGAVGIPLAVAGLIDPIGAIPVAFLLGLLWVAVVSGRLAIRADRPGRVDAPVSGIAVPVGA